MHVICSYLVVYLPFVSNVHLIVTSFVKLSLAVFYLWLVNVFCVLLSHWLFYFFPYCSVYPQVPIIDVPEYGTMSAVTACDRYKVTSQNDREQLDMAKGEVYRKGYYDGIMIVKGYEGEKVQDVKKRIQRLMINSVRWCHHSDFID